MFPSEGICSAFINGVRRHMETITSHGAGGKGNDLIGGFSSRNILTTKYLHRRTMAAPNAAVYDVHGRIYRIPAEFPGGNIGKLDMRYGK